MTGTSLAMGMWMALTLLPSCLWSEQDWDQAQACRGLGGEKDQLCRPQPSPPRPGNRRGGLQRAGAWAWGLVRPGLTSILATSWLGELG